MTLGMLIANLTPSYKTVYLIIPNGLYKSQNYLLVNYLTNLKHLAEECMTIDNTCSTYIYTHTCNKL